MSALRCRVGDLAMIVRTPKETPQYLGLPVTVVRPTHPRSYTGHGMSCAEPSWFVEASRPITLYCGRAFTTFIVPDCALRPIRPGDLSDETPTEIIEELTA